MIRRNSSLFLIGILALLWSCDTGNNVNPVFENYFIKYYGEDGNQRGVDLLVNADGTIVLLGNTTPSQNSTAQTPFIIKVDRLGAILWQRRLGTANEVAVDVELDNSGNLIVVSNVGDGAASRIRLTRVSQQGVGIDSLKIEMGEKQVARSVTQISDNSFLIAGFAEPNANRNPNLTPSPPDEADIIIVRVDEALTNPQVSFLDLGGGEHVGAAVKIFEETLNGSPKYFLFGDSDRPFDGSYNRSFEAIGIDLFGNAIGVRQVAGFANQTEICNAALRTTGGLQEGYLMVGTTSPANNSTSDIFLVQFDRTLSIKRLALRLDLGLRLEGISAAVGNADDFYVLANQTTANNMRDIVLLKLASDGTLIGAQTFGTLEGDDLAGSVSVLPDRRVAVFGTIELETQSKMALMIMSPEGKFSK